MPTEISCRDVGITVHIIARELRKVLGNFIESKNVRTFIATHKSLIIFIDDVLEKEVLMKSVGEIINRFNIKCEFKPLVTAKNKEQEESPVFSGQSVKSLIIDTYFLK